MTHLHSEGIDSLPRHIAIIMDGNGRWASVRGLHRSEGHHAGLKVTRRVVEFLANQGIPALTLFAFSSENWGRPRSEVDALMELFLSAIENELPDLIEKNIQLRFIGDRSHFSNLLQERMRDAEQACQENTGMQLAIALGYGGRWDILQAVEQCRNRKHRDQSIFSIEDFPGFLSTAGMPELDLVIRTGGEQRLSNFLLWQAAYAELYFTEVLWPDMTDKDVSLALADFAARQRRFGRVAAPEVALHD